MKLVTEVNTQKYHAAWFQNNLENSIHALLNAQSLNSRIFILTENHKNKSDANRAYQPANVFLRIMSLAWGNYVDFRNRDPISNFFLVSA